MANINKENVAKFVKGLEKLTRDTGIVLSASSQCDIVLTEQKEKTDKKCGYNVEIYNSYAIMIFDHNIYFTFNGDF